MINLNDFSQMTEDELTERISVMQSLRTHNGFNFILNELAEQYDTLTTRLLAASEPTDIYRTQGAMRAIADVLYESGGMRQRIIEAMKYEIDLRKEEKLNA